MNLVKKAEVIPLKRHKVFYIGLFFLSLFGLATSSIFTTFAPETRSWTLATILLASVSSSIFFPLTGGYFYNKFKEKQEGEKIWRAINEFSKGGIIKVYRDREPSDAQPDAVDDLRQAFETHTRGEVKISGVSLRVFFNQTGPFYPRIKQVANRHSYHKTKIKALVSDYESPEVYNRAKIETPKRMDEPLIEIDIHSTIISIEDLQERFGEDAIEYGFYSSAPYCTQIIFPDKCYVSQNILSPNPPVRLPMLVFNSNSHAYEKLDDYFDYLWANKNENSSYSGGQS